MKKKARQAILVLGMHRSGTSALTGILGLCGARLPAKQLPPHEDNPRGYFESERLMDIHDRLLAAAGTAWFNFERISDDWFQSTDASAFVDEIVEAVHEDYDDAPVFVVKDPRLCRLLPLWRMVLVKLGAQGRYALTHRNPIEVARSLKKRDGLPVAYGCLLWLRYMLDAEYETRGEPRVFEAYSEILLSPERSAESVAARLLLPELAVNKEKQSEIEAFIEPSLRRQVAGIEDIDSDAAFYPWLLKTYGALTSLVRAPNDHSAQQRLDEVRAVFNSAVDSFAPFVALDDHSYGTLYAKAGVDNTPAKRAKRISAFNELLAAQQNKTKSLQKQVAEQDLELSALRQTVRDVIPKIAELESTVVALCQSNSWRFTAPLRALKRAVTGAGEEAFDESLLYGLKSGRRSVAARRSRRLAYVYKNAKFFVKRVLGLRLSKNVAGRIERTRIRGRKLTDIDDSITGPVSSAAYEDAYLANAQYAMGAHSPFYGAKVPKRAPAERCDVKLIAYYLPQFHPIPENDRWWGAGFTEWRNVTRAFPLFVGHDQPRLPGELGYYDLRVPDVMRQQVELAKLHGITAFCFHFYWFGGKRLLELPIDNFLRDQKIDLKFCLCWANENWTRRWDGADQEILISQSHAPEDDVAFIWYVKKYFDDPRYLRIDGKPVLTVYRPGVLPDIKGSVERWRSQAERMGLPGLYLIATNSFGFSQYRQCGFDALSEFPPHGTSALEYTNIQLLHPNFEGKIFSYPEVMEDYEGEGRAVAPGAVILPGVMPGWDNTARRVLRAHVFCGSTPALFYDWLMRAIARAQKNRESERIVVINAWNEWAEGAYLEPDRNTGHARLAACAAAISGNLGTDSRVADLFKQSRQNFKAKHLRAVVIHLFYEDLAEWFSRKVSDFGDVDVYVTVEKTIDWETAQHVARTFDTAYILEVENRGRDIRPFLSIYPHFVDKNYEFVCKLHTKKSPHLSEGDRWREGIVDQLLSRAAKEALELNRGEPAVGVLAARGSLETLEDPNIRVRSEKNLVALATRLNCEINYSDSFVAGSMFWFRPEIVRHLHKIIESEFEFEPELGQIDGTLAHAIERIFCIAAKTAGMSTKEIGDVPINRPTRWA